MKKTSTLLIIFLLVYGSPINATSNNKPNIAMYFPFNSGTDWETISPAKLGWNPNAIQPLKDFLSAKNTKSFIILVNGRILMEEYFDGHSVSTEWKWNSAGKTLVSATTGIAAQEGLLTINNKVSDYLGTGWTNMQIEKENLITVKHLLSMTSGIDTKQLTIKSNLTYVSDAGTKWAYGNVFQKLINVVSQASKQDFETYFNTKLKNKIGMDGYWNFGKIFSIYHSTTRSMARFGLLALNKGKWQNQQIINKPFFTESINTSQNINQSYGYFWWLNGKPNFMTPGKQTIHQGYLVPHAPADMYAAMGAADQRIYVIPSKKMVVIRIGNASNPTKPNFAASNFDNELWAKINAVIN